MQIMFLVELLLLCQKAEIKLIKIGSAYMLLNIKIIYNLYGQITYTEYF